MAIIIGAPSLQGLSSIPRRLFSAGNQRRRSPVYYSYSLVIYRLGQNGYPTAGGSIPQTYPSHSTPWPPWLTQGDWVFMTGELRTPHRHVPSLQRSCQLPGTAARRGLALATSTTRYHWPLFLVQKSHPQGPVTHLLQPPHQLYLHFLRYKHRYTVGSLMTTCRIPIKAPLQRRACKEAAILVSQKLAFSPRIMKVIPALQGKAGKTQQSDLFFCWRRHSNKSNIKKNKVSCYRGNGIWTPPISSLLHTCELSCTHTPHYVSPVSDVVPPFVPGPPLHTWQNQSPQPSSLLKPHPFLLWACVPFRR